MSYSATNAAMQVLDIWSDFCFSQTGAANTYQSVDGRKYFWEIGKENSDGAITGTSWLFINDGLVIKAGSWRINPNGAVKRYPKGFTHKLVNSGDYPNLNTASETFNMLRNFG